MGECMLLRRGGTGGTATIIVGGLSSTDTVTCTAPSGTSASGTFMGDAVWVFSGLKEKGTYTITATDGTHTATDTVVVSAMTAYAVTMDYNTYLYKDGDGRTSLTGGWVSHSELSGNVAPTFGSSEISFDTKTTGSSAYNTRARTVNKVDVSSYDTLCVQFNDIATNGSNTDRNINGGVWNSATSVASRRNSQYLTEVSGLSETLQLDISSITGSYYISVGAFATFTPSSNLGKWLKCSVSKIWLE